ncbi:XRE family transcriptional regulator [Candidatus Parcubacteria bacterium]|nr:MAG: XRE family transcriptional regulator [Candidatus Parcubacteria bacterium]
MNSRPAQPVVHTLIELFKATRRRRHWSGYQLAERTWLSQGQISRIESGKSELTLPAAVKLAFGLGIPYEQAAGHVGVPAIQPARPLKATGQHFFITPLDAAFLGAYLASQDGEWDAPPEIQIAIATALTDTPSRGRRASRPTLLPHPGARLSWDILQEMYHKDCLLTFEDFGASVRHWRLKAGLSGEELADHLRGSKINLYAIEKGERKMLPVSTVLQLEHILQAKGWLLAFAWRAAEHFTGLYRHHVEASLGITLPPHTGRETDLLNKVLFTARWCLVLGEQDSAWLDDLRARAKEYSETVVRPTWP